MSRSLSHEATVAQAKTLLSLGSTSDQLVEWAATQFPPDEVPDMAAIEAEARERMVDAAGEHVSWSSACRLQRLTDLYARTMHTQDYKACLAIEKELNVAKAEREREAKVASRSDRRDR